jgi:Ferritin-like
MMTGMAESAGTGTPQRQSTDASPQGEQPGLRSGGRLAHVLSVRGKDVDPEAPIRIEHREALIYVLGKAAELEHLVLCQYLFAAFSLKDGTREGLSDVTMPLVEHWRDELIDIAEQEMLHFALVQNLLTAVGAAPHLGRPNFPVPPRAFPAKVQLVLMPFGEVALRHFAYLERPEGMDMADAEGFAALAKAQPLAAPPDELSGPIVPEFDTISHLYRSLEDGLAQLADRLGEPELFVGPPAAQATPTAFDLPDLVPVTDLASARRAIDTIVEQGEGARGDWREAHFGRILAILDQFLAARELDPAFEPARPVLLASVRPPDSGVDVPLITAPFSVRCVDLMNAIYEVLLQMLSRYFAHTDESDEQLTTLAEVSVDLMEDAVAPLGAMVTKLPVGEGYEGHTVGPMFELFYAVDYLLPHRAAAWTLMTERLREVAEFAMRCRNECPPGLMLQLSMITEVLKKQSDRLAAAAG